MQLLIRDALETLLITEPIREAWVDHPFDYDIVDHDLAQAVGNQDAALCSVADLPWLNATHAIVPEFGVVSDEKSAVVAISKSRLDDLDRATVGTGLRFGRGALLGQALLNTFYGVEELQWIDGSSPSPDISILEGYDALREPASEHAVDLGQAWFILTGFAVASHVLVVPTAMEHEEVRVLLDVLVSALGIGIDRRKAITRAAANQHAVERPAMASMLRSQRYSMNAEDLESTLMLLRQGRSAPTVPYVSELAVRSVEE